MSQADAFVSKWMFVILNGSGRAATQTRPLSGFQAISMLGDIDVVVRQRGSEGVQVRADDNILPLVQTWVEGSADSRTLRIQYKPGESLRARTKVVVTVDVMKLSAVASAGSGAPILVDGRRTHVVGRVSMDKITVDITDIPLARVGSAVELWGAQLAVDELAHAAGTIGYELLTAVAPRVPRRLI